VAEGARAITDSDLHLIRTVEEFLFKEAELLDAGRYRDWLGLLSADIDYRIPTRATRERTALDLQFSETSFHMVEDRGSLETRVARFDTEYAWSENPPSRTRRFVSNVRLGSYDPPIDVRSNLLFFWARDELPQVILSGERHDLIRVEDGELKLAVRVVFLDHTTLPIPNLAVFL
jgi:3-phenylpropionate/cinnamic acid dioxygenase small subunit